jgi:hypothetical protein
VQVSIGLPSFLVNQDSKKLVVLAYVGVLCILVPILVFWWYVSMHPPPLVVVYCCAHTMPSWLLYASLACM